MKKKFKGYEEAEIEVKFIIERRESKLWKRPLPVINGTIDPKYVPEIYTIEKDYN